MPQQEQDILDIYKDVDRAYESELGLFALGANQPELDISPVSKELRSIGRQIEDLRADRLHRQYFAEQDQKSKTVKFVRGVSKTVFGKDFIGPKQIPLTEAILKNWENEIGINIFTPSDEYSIEAFFNDDINNWYFKRVFEDHRGDPIEDVLHYEILDDGVLKISNRSGEENRFLEGDELTNFVYAAQVYRDKIVEKVYTPITSPSKKAS